MAASENWTLELFGLFIYFESIIVFLSVFTEQKVFLNLKRTLLSFLSEQTR